MIPVIYVYAGWLDEEPLIGTYRADRQNRIVMFQYDESWILKYRLNIDPMLTLTSGWQYLPHAGNDRTFGFISDASPDRWGRNLVRRKEAHTAREEKRRARTLFPEDYLVGISDVGRQGGLRFKTSVDGDFLSPQSDIPKMTDLRVLEQSARILENVSDPHEYSALQDIFDPGSSLGGARPKANVRDPEGNIWIAKFQSKNDIISTGAWEMTAHDLAALCGICVPEARLLRIDDRTVFLSRRFDRQKNKRIHMMSMMTALEETDGSAQEHGKGFLDMAEYISYAGAHIKDDLLELYRRLVFTVAISNTDCHFRNHAMLLTSDGWVLSPAYDMNPNPEKDSLAINITDADASIDMELVRETASFYQLTDQQAEEIIASISDTVKTNWRRIAGMYQIPEREMTYMGPAFSGE